MDKRKARNKQALRDALIDNCNGDAYSMTVSQLCDIAQVSRAAFYNYYEGIHSIIEEVEREYLEPLLDPNLSISLPGTLQTATTLLGNKREWLFMFNNGRAYDVTLKEVKRFVMEHMRSRHCNISDNLLTFYVNGAAVALLDVCIYLMSKEEPMSAQMLSKIFETIEQRTYDMIEEITLLGQ